jgi:ferrous iron transport protein A
MTLAELDLGEIAQVVQIQAQHQQLGLARRLAAIGITPDKQIEVLRKAYFKGPLHIRVGTTTEIAIRRQEAQMIQVCCLDCI